MKLYLASGSRRRKHLLSWMGLDFESIEHGVDEDEYRNEDGKAMVGELALAKAYGGMEQVKEGLIIGSDLTVVLEGKQYGKPKDLKEAKKFLKALSGKTHVIYCGVAVVDKKSQKAVMSIAESRVKMKKYDSKVIEKYIKEFEVLDKGGGYAIQFLLSGYGSLVKSFNGGMTTIVGLPMLYLETLLGEFGVKPKKNWRKACKQETGYEY